MFIRVPPALSYNAGRAFTADQKYFPRCESAVLPLCYNCTGTLADRITGFSYSIRRFLCNYGKNHALTKITSVTVGVNSEGPPGIGQRSAAVNPGWLDPMSARSLIGPGKCCCRCKCCCLGHKKEPGRDPGRLGIEPIPGIVSIDQSVSLEMKCPCPWG